MKAVPDKAALLISWATSNKLPSVRNPGQVMGGTIISSGAVPGGAGSPKWGVGPPQRAGDSRRQGGTESKNHHPLPTGINHGSMPDLRPARRPESDFYLVQAGRSEPAVGPHHRTAKKNKAPQAVRVQSGSAGTSRVLCPLNRGRRLGGRGRFEHRHACQGTATQPAGDRKVERFGWNLPPGGQG